ncbi:hypothetical protein ZIOFF_048806 [Zingiber officinale]|uniref:Uncharacterized protein n=1 Tax=Zingiber officinale TaxID=94328 RepID=A0A8J5KX01_ZINOF|nr:hypothetical protein ZIOFF_048806 [Zingiber officinale]
MMLGRQTRPHPNDQVLPHFVSRFRHLRSLSRQPRFPNRRRKISRTRHGVRCFQSKPDFLLGVAEAHGSRRTTCGYTLVMREACKYVEEKLSVKVEKLGKESLTNCAKTKMSSKLIAIDSDFFANLVSSAHVY